MRQLRDQIDVRRRENTRARLVEAAVEVFVERGSRRVTIDDLVSAAGYTRGAFYSNFASVEEVLIEAFQLRTEMMLASLAESAALVADDRRIEAAELIEVLFDSVAGVELEWYALQVEVGLVCIRDEHARRLAWPMRQQFDVRLQGLAEAVLARLDRRATVPVAKLGEIAAALYLHSLGIRILEPARSSSPHLVVEMLPRLLEGLSEPITVRLSSSGAALVE